MLRCDQTSEGRGCERTRCGVIPCIGLASGVGTFEQCLHNGLLKLLHFLKIGGKKRRRSEDDTQDGDSRRTLPGIVARCDHLIEDSPERHPHRFLQRPAPQDSEHTRRGKVELADDEVFLGLKVPEDTALGHADRSSNVINGRFFITALDEQGMSRVGDLLLHGAAGAVPEAARSRTQMILPILTVTDIYCT